MTKIYDALIIGRGPAGLSTALGLSRVHRTCVVFSDAKYRNEGATAHSILTREHTPSKDLLALGQKDIEKYGSTDFVATTITAVTKARLGDQDGFAASDAGGQTWQGKTVVLATGVRDVFPPLPGYAENWPRNIYRCPFCDGHERWKQPVGILCYPKWSPPASKMATMAHFISMPAGVKAEGRSSVTIFTNGSVNESTEAQRIMLDTCTGHGIKVEHRPVVRLEKAVDDEGVYVHVQDPDKKTIRVFVGWMLHKPPTAMAAKELVEQLGLKVVDGMFGKIIGAHAPFQNTNVKGVFTCGDAGVNMTHVTTAMMTEQSCAAGMAHYCNELADNEVLAIYRGQTPST